MNQTTFHDSPRPQFAAATPYGPYGTEHTSSANWKHDAHTHEHYVTRVPPPHDPRPPPQPHHTSHMCACHVYGKRCEQNGTHGYVCKLYYILYYTTVSVYPLTARYTHRTRSAAQHQADSPLKRVVAVGENSSDGRGIHPTHPTGCGGSNWRAR